MPDSTTDGAAVGKFDMPDAATLLADDSPAVPDSGSPAADLAEPRDSAGATDDPPVVEADAPSPDAALEPDAADPAPEPATYDPFSFTVDGTEVSIPGSYETEDGMIVIPRDAWDQTFARQYVADRGAFRQRETALQAKLEVLQAQVNAPNPEVQQYKLLSDKVLDMLNNPEKLLEFVDNHEKQLPELMAQIEREKVQQERDYWKQIAENGGKKPEPEPTIPDEQQIAQLAQSFEPGLKTAISTLVKDLGDAVQGADPEAVFGLAWAQADRVFFEAQEDLPQFGMKKGQIGVDLEFLEQLLTYDANARRAAAKAGSAAAGVKETNDRVLAGARRRAPATPGSTPRPPGSNSEKKMDAQEWQRRFRAGELDD